MKSIKDFTGHLSILFVICLMFTATGEAQTPKSIGLWRWGTPGLTTEPIRHVAIVRGLFKPEWLQIRI